MAPSSPFGITRGTPDPDNGHIVLDADGNPTGMLHEDAAISAAERLPQITPGTCLAGLRAGQAHANRHGITGIIDPKIIPEYATAYGALAASGDLTLRVSGAASVTPADTAATAPARLTAQRTAYPGPDFHINAAKFFFDGVLENRTAAMIDSYADSPGNAPVMFSPHQIAATFTALDAARFQFHVHVIGDMAARANREAGQRRMARPAPTGASAGHRPRRYPPNRRAWRHGQYPTALGAL